MHPFISLYLPALIEALSAFMTPALIRAALFPFLLFSYSRPVILTSASLISLVLLPCLCYSAAVLSRRPVLDHLQYISVCVCVHASAMTIQKGLNECTWMTPISMECWCHVVTSNTNTQVWQEKEYVVPECAPWLLWFSSIRWPTLLTLSSWSSCLRRCSELEWWWWRPPTDPPMVWPDHI